MQRSLQAGVARNLANERRRQRERESSLRTQLYSLSESNSHEPSHEGIIANRQHLDVTLQSLPRDMQRTLELVIEGPTHQQIAGRLGISRHAVVRLVRQAHDQAESSIRYLHAMTGQPQPPPRKINNVALYRLG